jgi:HAD superfamily hydrolase (TIGR01509 family)
MISYGSLRHFDSIFVRNDWKIQNGLQYMRRQRAARIILNSSRNMTIDALVFDFDGLIIDTESVSHLAWQELYRSYNQELVFDQWVHLVGGRSTQYDPFADLHAKTGRVINRDETIEWLYTRMRQLLKDTQPLPGVLDTIHTARRMGLKLAVASASLAQWVHPLLERLELKQYFDAVCTRDEVTRMKPDPAVYLLALERIGVQPHRAVALEDSRNGMLAAKAAGMYCVAIPNPITAGLDFSPADRVLPSMKELALATLAERLPAQPRRLEWQPS